MGDVIKFRRRSRTERAQGKTLCRSGFHKWKVIPGRRFDVKLGRLVTLSRCERCGHEKSELL